MPQTMASRPGLVLKLFNVYFLFLSFVGIILWSNLNVGPHELTQAYASNSEMTRKWQLHGLSSFILLFSLAFQIGISYVPEACTYLFGKYPLAVHRKFYELSKLFRYPHGVTVLQFSSFYPLGFSLSIYSQVLNKEISETANIVMFHDGDEPKNRPLAWDAQSLTGWGLGLSIDVHDVYITSWKATWFQVAILTVSSK